MSGQVYQCHAAGCLCIGNFGIGKQLIGKDNIWFCAEHYFMSEWGVSMMIERHRAACEGADDDEL